MARAMRASGLGKPNATRVRTRIFVLVGSTIRPQLVEEHAHSGLVQALSRPDAAQINQCESSSTTAVKYRLPRLTVRAGQPVFDGGGRRRLTLVDLGRVGAGQGLDKATLGMFFDELGPDRRTDQYEDPRPDPSRVRLPQTRSPHRPGHARPRGLLPTTTRPSDHEMTHRSSRGATLTRDTRHGPLHPRASSIRGGLH